MRYWNSVAEDCALWSLLKIPILAFAHQHLKFSKWNILASNSHYYANICYITCIIITIINVNGIDALAVLDQNKLHENMNSIRAFIAQSHSSISPSSPQSVQSNRSFHTTFRRQKKAKKGKKLLQSKAIVQSCTQKKLCQATRAILADALCTGNRSERWRACRVERERERE